MTSSDQTYFSNDWLKHKDYKDWIVKTNDSKIARCHLCTKTISLSNMGVQALKSHMKGEKHKKAAGVLKPTPRYFKPCVKTAGKTSINKEGQSSKQATLDLVLHSKEELKTEIKWTLASVMYNISSNASSSMTKLFSSLFPDSKFAQDVALGRTKINYVINFGLAPYFKSLLIEEVEKSPYYVVSFDESLNKVTQTCQMDLIVRFWNELSNEVEVRYLNSTFLGYSSASDILNHFNKETEILNLSRMLQISMDGSSTNWKFFNELSIYRCDWKLNPLIDETSIVVASIIMHGAFKTGAESTSWDIKSVLKGSYQILHDTPTRRDDYTSITVSETFPLSFCATRWIEDRAVADRLIELWDNITKIIAYWEKLPKSKQPSSKSFFNVCKAVKDPLTVSKLQYFSYVTSHFEPYLTPYQTDQPMLPYMYDDILELIKNILSPFLKPSVIENCKISANLLKLDLMKNENLLPTKSITVGFAADVSLKELLWQDKITPIEASQFRKDCILFLTNAMNKVFERSPLRSTVVRNAACFHLIKMKTNTIETNQNKLKRLLHHLVSLKLVSTNDSDKTMGQYTNLLRTDMQINISKFECFDRKTTRLDIAYSKIRPDLLLFRGFA